MPRLVGFAIAVPPAASIASTAEAHPSAERDAITTRTPPTRGISGAFTSGEQKGTASFQ